MRVQQVQLELDHLSPEVIAAHLGATPPSLIFAFAGLRAFRDASLRSALERGLAGTACVGCSTAGEISSRSVLDDSLVLTVVRFEHAEVAVVEDRVADMEDSSAAGRRLGDALRAHQPDHVIVFAPGVDVNGSALIAGLEEVLGGVPIAGGLAADGGRFEETFVLTPTGSGPRRLVGVALKGERLRVRHGSFGGWQPFGPIRRVTGGLGSVLRTLDGERALDVYRRYLGSHAAGLPGTALLFPLAVLDPEGNDTGLVRTILGIDEADGSLTLAGDLSEGTLVRLMHASTDALVRGARRAAETAESSTGDGLALLVTCVGRKLVMGLRVDEEIEAVAEVLGRATTLAGFYSNGEISPGQGLTSCRLHNQTMTVTTLQER